MKKCLNCLNDSTVKNIKFNDQGICNYCSSYLDEYAIWHDFNTLESIFSKKIEKVKGKYTYDVVIPFSGGKDSTYVLYQMKKNYNLKMKAFTIDNGFLSLEAKNKINDIVNNFDIEHEYVYVEEEFLKTIYNYITNKFLSPCIACSYIGYAMMINYATKVNAGMCIHGRSRSQMFRYYATSVDDTFKPLIQNGLKELTKQDLETMYLEILNKVDKNIDKKLSNKMYETLLKDAKGGDFREFVGYFLYHDYDQNEIIDTISKNTPWKVLNQEEHFDCLIHNATKYIKNIVAKRNHSLPEISFMIRDGKITKSEAYEMIKKENIECPDEELDLMCNYMRINKRKLLLKAKIYAKRWW